MDPVKLMHLASETPSPLGLVLPPAFGRLVGLAQGQHAAPKPPASHPRAWQVRELGGGRNL